MLIEIHMLKNYAPTNLNRDDTGAPKTCMFGGVQRGRISSQCLKRSWRTSPILADAFDLGIRTRMLPVKIGERLEKSGLDEKEIKAVKKLVSEIGISKKNKGKNEEDSSKKKDEEETNKTNQIIFYSPEEINALVEYLGHEIQKIKKAEKDEAKILKKISGISLSDFAEEIKNRSKRSVSIDMALFGRMVTSDLLDNMEASMQVAHAVSTNKVNMESDYFTAVDDLIADSADETGSGMIGDIDYNSSCYYIYASLDTDKLLENLKNCENASEIVRKAIPALVETMAFSNPSGKQNSFAGHSLPSAVLVECRERKIPVSYVNAYEKPVRAKGDSGIVGESVSRLKAECLKTEKLFGLKSAKRLWFTTEDVTFENGEAVNCAGLPELIAALPEA